MTWVVTLDPEPSSGSLNPNCLQADASPVPPQCRVLYASALAPAVATFVGPLYKLCEKELQGDDVTVKCDPTVVCVHLDIHIFA